LSSTLRKFQGAARATNGNFNPFVIPFQANRRRKTVIALKPMVVRLMRRGSSTSGSPTGQDLIAKNRKPDAIINYHIDH
jgi:hypothetical protein